MDKIKNTIKKWSQEGLRWPFVHDPVKGKPSVTLMFFYISYFTAAIAVIISSLLLFIKDDPLLATIMPVLMLFSTFAFYRLRRLDRFKIDLENKSIDLFGDANESTEDEEDYK